MRFFAKVSTVQPRPSLFTENVFPKYGQKRQRHTHRLFAVDFYLVERLYVLFTN